MMAGRQGLNSALGLGWHACHEAEATYVRTWSVRPASVQMLRKSSCRLQVRLQVADCRWALAVAALVSITSLITRAEGIIDESNILIVQIQQILTVRLESAERFCCERHLLRFEADLSGGESSESGTT